MDKNKLNLSDMMIQVFSAKWYEPEASTRDMSVKELSLPHYIKHRFPFKGGITFGQVMQGDMSKNNVLYRQLKEKGHI